jgi:hypothetical protein
MERMQYKKKDMANKEIIAEISKKLKVRTFLFPLSLSP